MARTKKNEMLLTARCVLSECSLAALLQRLREQAICAFAAFVGSEVINLVEVNAIDLSERNEFDDVDCARRFFFERLQLFGR